MATSAWLLASGSPARAEHSWSGAVSGASADLVGVWGASKTDLYAVSREGAILHSTDGGKAWTSRSLPGGGALGAVYGRDPDTVYVVGGPHVARSNDKGASWTVVYTGNADDHWNGVFAVGAGDVYAVGAKGAIAYSSDSGATWTRQTSNTGNDLNAVWGSASSDIYAVGAGGVLLHTEDSGANWNPDSAGVGDEDLSAVWGTGKDNVWAVGASGSILHGKGGGSWTSAWKWDRPLSSVWGSGKSDLWVVAPSGGQVLHTVDGKKFQQVKSGVETSLRAVWVGGPDDVWMVGEVGVVMRNVPKGKTFEQRLGIKGSGHEVLAGVWGSGPDDLYAVGYLDNAGTTKVPHTAEILHSKDSGRSWAFAYRSAVAQQIFGVWGSGPGNVFAVGSGGAILRSKDGGKTWEALRTTAPIKTSLVAVWGSGAEDVFVVGEKGKVLHTRDGGKVWAVEKAPVLDYKGVWGTDKDNAYAAGIDGDKHELVVAHTVDGGKTWKEAFRGGGWTTGGLGGVWGSAKNDVWAWNESDAQDLKLVHSTDEGKTFTPVTAGKGLLHALWGDGKSLFVCTPGGDVLHSGDGGKTWADDKSGTVEALNAMWGSGPDNVYAVGDKGMILHAVKK